MRCLPKQGIIDIQERKPNKSFLTRLKWQRLSKNCHSLFKTKWLHMSSAPVVLHPVLNDQSRHMHKTSQRTLTMIVGVMALRSQHMCCVVFITECHNSHKHSQSPLTSIR